MCCQGNGSNYDTHGSKGKRKLYCGGSATIWYWVIDFRIYMYYTRPDSFNGRMSASGTGRPGLIPGRVIYQGLKNGTYRCPASIQHYWVRIGVCSDQDFKYWRSIVVFKICTQVKAPLLPSS